MGRSKLRNTSFDFLKFIFDNLKEKHKTKDGYASLKTLQHLFNHKLSMNVWLLHEGAKNGKK